MLGNAAGQLVRLTPEEDADLSPAISPAGDMLAMATGSGETGKSNIVICSAADGSDRRIVARNGGWPSFAADGRGLYFHRRTGNAEDGWCVPALTSDALVAQHERLATS